jgi:butyrate kinase
MKQTSSEKNRGAENSRGRLESVTDLVEIAGKAKPSTVVIAGGHRTEDLQLVESARDHGIIDRIVLVGREKEVLKAVDEVGIQVSKKDIIAAPNDEEVAAATVELVRAGNIDVVLKGGISTPVINRHMLKLAVRPTVSLATIFEASPIADGRPMILTDAGVTTVCNFGRLVNLIDNAVQVARVVMGVERPRVAVLSANEKQIPSLPSTWLGKKLTQRTWPHAFVCGPLSFDLATDPESVTVKGLPDLPWVEEVAGRADILLCPGIDAANILYKTITAMTKFGQATLAGITVGFSVPYIILSRADTLETRLLSIALCSIYSQRISERSKSEAQVSTPGENKYRILVLNPGSTSFKLAVYENTHALHSEEITHNFPPLNSPGALDRQIKWAEKVVSERIDRWGVKKLDAIGARGGLLPRPLKKLKGGTYVIASLREGQVIVDRNIVDAMRSHPAGSHASNLGIPLAALLAEKYRVGTYTVDPVIVDEFIPEAEFSGYAPIRRKSLSHALSIRAAAMKSAEIIGRPLKDVNLIVVHLGGGISVAAVRQGLMIDNNIALLGEGPFSPQRTGSLPVGELIDLCFSGKFTREELKEELSRNGGLQSYLGEYRMDVIEERIKDGDRQAQKIVEAMVYGIAKEVGAMFVSTGCDVEAIVLTGGLVRNSRIRDALKKRFSKLAPVVVFEDNLEMPALASGVVEVLSGREKPMRYRSR